MPLAAENPCLALGYRRSSPQTTRHLGNAGLEFFPITMFFNSETNQVRIGKIRCDADSDRSLEFNFSIAAEGMRERKQTIKIELSNLIDCGKIPTRGKKDE